MLTRPAFLSCCCLLFGGVGLWLAGWLVVAIVVELAVGCLACTVSFHLALFILIRGRGAITFEFENVILSFWNESLEYSCNFRVSYVSPGLSVVGHCHPHL